MTKYDHLKEQLEWKIKDWRAEADELCEEIAENRSMTRFQVTKREAIANTKYQLAEKLEYILLIAERSEE